MQGGTRTYWYFNRMLLNELIQDLRFKSFDCLDETVPTGHGGRGLAVVYGSVLAPLLAESIKTREKIKTTKRSLV